jgi:uncharacterized protein with HEPN domain
MWRDDAFALDMLLAARRARAYLGDASAGDLEADTLLQDAIVRQLGILGEAAGKVSDEYQSGHAGVPWRAIVGMRNRLVHEYWSVDVVEVWRTVTDDLPGLIGTLEELVPPE